MRSLSSGQPIAGERRHNPGPDHRYERDHRREPQTPSQTGGKGLACSFEVHQQVGYREQDDGERHHQIAPASRDGDVSRHKQRKRDREGDIDHGHDPQ